MIGVALKMLAGDRGKFLAIVIGIAFSSFLTAYAACYFAGFMSRSYALVAEHAGVDIWVMDAKTVSAEQFANMPESALYRVRSVAGVAAAERMAIGQA
ncbi:MAG TPA: hypothetical protein VKQ27_19210, partial [Acetobacteraceae bacterium]|nr:hypothetical protein [Acetobacteraceae bacterium]